MRKVSFERIYQGFKQLWKHNDESTEQKKYTLKLYWLDLVNIGPLTSNSSNIRRKKGERTSEKTNSKNGVRVNSKAQALV